ncbi:hypothetical protein [Kluyvera intermedia]|uniref:hypothetical protein n=1 Tax=Kluyvera intermedia TaxID=61648 RepID=UPI0035258FB2
MIMFVAALLISTAAGAYWSYSVLNASCEQATRVWQDAQYDVNLDRTSFVRKEIIKKDLKVLYAAEANYRQECGGSE